MPTRRAFLVGLAAGPLAVAWASGVGMAPRPPMPPGRPSPSPAISPPRVFGDGTYGYGRYGGGTYGSPS